MKTIDYTSGANPLGPSHKARNAIRSHVRHISACDTLYLNRLKNFIAKREGIDEACILFGCGSTVILSSILKLIRPGKILIPHPVSRRYSTLLSRYGREISVFPLKSDDNFELNVEGFCRAMKGCEAAILPIPHDMAGSVISPDEALKILDDAESHGIHLILDESYSEYTGMPTLSPVTTSGKVVIVRTFSTFHALGGLRLGYAMGPPDLLHVMEASLDPSTINSLAPQAAMASMKDKGYRRRTLLFVETEKAYLAKMLSDIKGVKCHVSPTNMLVICLQKDHLDVGSMFKKHHILIRLFTDENGNTCISFPVQARRHNANFARVLKRIMEA
jgi:histidinol-phosphate/aromatic aminotransferase/cobyric acid decarboxylase-like protein